MSSSPDRARPTEFRFRSMEEASVRAISSWRYESPYDVYNWASDEIETTMNVFLDPSYAYFAISDQAGELLAYCCFGVEAQVPGGDYSRDALDVGLGVRPDLTGQGLGLAFVRAVLDFACRTFAPDLFRVTVAEFNKRALRVWQKAGFQPVQVFPRRRDGLSFVVLTCRLCVEAGPETAGGRAGR